MAPLYLLMLMLRYVSPLHHGPSCCPTTLALPSVAVFNFKAVSRQGHWYITSESTSNATHQQVEMSDLSLTWKSNYTVNF